MVVELGFVVRSKPALHRYMINATLPKKFLFGTVIIFELKHFPSELARSSIYGDVAKLAIDEVEILYGKSNLRIEFLL
jgi:hypothetical protein